MERRPINHSNLFGEHFDHQVEWLGRFEFDEIEDKIPFLQMLQSADQSQTTTSPSFCWGLREPSFQTLLKLQHAKKSPLWESDTNFDLSHHHHEIIMDSGQSYVDDGSPAKSEAVAAPQQDQAAGLDQLTGQDVMGKATQGLTLTKERRKRKRARAVKNKEEVESQRMTHIAVERNRRRQMNDHLNVLRSLMPSSYIQRGDQASIVGGAIDFVKELEQLLQSLEAQKRMRKPREEISSNSVLSHSSSSSTSSSSSSSSSSSIRDGGGEARAENKSEIEATVIQTHVNLKVRCSQRPGQLLEAIVALEELRLSVLHLNVTSSSDHTILYSFNLKIEDDCQLGSADEIAGEVHRIFRTIDQQS